MSISLFCFYCLGYITPDELKNVKPNILSQYIKEFLEEHPEKHSRYSKQTWLFPDQSRDEVFENIQRRCV